jgi:hypothetical protein
MKLDVMCGNIEDGGHLFLNCKFVKQETAKEGNVSGLWKSRDVYWQAHFQQWK